MLARKLFKARAQNQPVKDEKDEFPTLSNIAIDIIANNFELYPTLENIPPIIKDKIIDKSSPNLSIKITAQNIQNEKYWHRAYIARWGKDALVQIEQHGNSWKTSYLERYIEEYLSKIEVLDEQVEAELLDILKVSHNWVFQLNVADMKCSLDIDKICQNLPLLTHIDLTYGIKYAGMKYQRQVFGMKLGEAANLQSGLLNHCNNLLYLKLSGNSMDDDLVRFIMQGLNYNISLLELDLSHNKISDQGARRIAKFLMRNEILLTLDLGDNIIGNEGAKFLGHALKVNKTLQSINLKINNFTDKSGVRMFKDLINNKSLIFLNLSSNKLGILSARKISDYLSDPLCCLKVLDLSGNNFDDECFEILKNDAFNKNVSLEKLNIQNCKFSKNEYMARELQEIVIKHYLGSQKIPFLGINETILQKEQQQKELLAQQQQIAQQQAKLEEAKKEQKKQ